MRTYLTFLNGFQCSTSGHYGAVVYESYCFNLLILLLYFLTASFFFLIGWHKGQPYTKDSKVKSFIQWIKTQKETSHMEKTSIGGYYPFPPVPDTFLKYCKSIKGTVFHCLVSDMLAGCSDNLVGEQNIST